MNSLKYWLQVALFVVPIAYVCNFIYAIASDQTGGTFGDTFGAANALFSGAALMMLVYAVILQREELSIVKSERDDTRKILEGQEGLNKLQKQALERQIFEQGFYSLLEVAIGERNRLSQSFSPESPGAASHLRMASSATKTVLKCFISGSEIDNRTELYFNECFYYVNLLCHLSDSIDEAPLSDEEKVSYGQLIVALLEPKIAFVTVAYAIKFSQAEERMQQIFRFCDRHRLHRYLVNISEAAELVAQAEEVIQTRQ